MKISFYVSTFSKRRQWWCGFRLSIVFVGFRGLNSKWVPSKKFKNCGVLTFYLALVVLMNTSVSYFIFFGDEIRSLLLLCSWFGVLCGFYFYITCMRSDRPRKMPKKKVLIFLNFVWDFDIIWREIFHKMRLIVVNVTYIAVLITVGKVFF